MVKSINEEACAHAGIRNISAAAVLACLKQGLRTELPGRLDPVMELARSVPAYSGNMLELHFNRGEAWFDFATRANLEYDRPLLADKRLRDQVDPFIGKVYLHLFDEQKAAFRYGIENICFEYDAPFETHPSVFFDVHRTTGLGPDKKYRDLKTITDGFELPLPAELFHFLVNIKASHLDAVYFGLMFSRETASIRLTINGVKPGRLAETLSRLGWCGNRDVLLDLGNRYLHSAQRLVLAVDFSDRLASRIGIEVFDEKAGSLLQKLHGDGVINAEQYRFLQEWPGQTALEPGMAAGFGRLHQRAVNCLYRRINHLKFTVQDQLLNTKAYLYYCF